MRLRNKKTGEVFDVLIREKGGAGSYSLIVCDIKAYEQSKSTLDATHFVLDEYETLAELLDEWEDYVPKEPLIKDGKIRKAVRAWAEANDANVVSICALSGGWGVRYDLEDKEGYGSIDLLFKGNAPLGVGNQYTIDELCGEENE